MLIQVIAVGKLKGSIWCRAFRNMRSGRPTDLVTIGTDDYRVYRYEGKFNSLENGVVLLCWKEGEGFDPKKS